MGRAGKYFLIFPRVYATPVDIDILGPMGKHIHRLSNVDIDNAIGDCAHCGSGVRLTQITGKPRCWNSRVTKIPGLSRVDREKFLTGKSCAVCGGTDELVPDHNHETGEIRGVLWRRHNLALGQLQDTPAHIEALLLYVLSTNSVDVLGGPYGQGLGEIA